MLVHQTEFSTGTLEKYGDRDPQNNCSGVGAAESGPNS